MEAELTLYYAPRTRSRTAIWMLEELGCSYSLEVFDIRSGRQREPEFLALNPMGKVPTLVVDGKPVAELGAIALWLGDRFIERGLAPAVDDPARADYLRWAFFASAIMEPALAEVAFKLDLPSGSVAWGSYARMERALIAGLDAEAGDWLLGERFTMADCLVGAALLFGKHFGMIDTSGLPVFEAYIGRLTGREAYQRMQAIEAREAARLDAS